MPTITGTLPCRTWQTKVKRKLKTKFIFIGAGGGSLLLLEKSGIPEGKGFGGFPVSGQWLKCVNPEVIEQHAAKVYGKASVGAPPMSVPHLDTRMINGKKALLFGPYAGFSTKFLKHGSFFDMPLSIKANNILPMMKAGLDNIPLTKYLIDQVRQSPQDRLDALKEYCPTAKMEDWELEIAGQRVQVIKKDPVHGWDTGVWYRSSNRGRWQHSMPFRALRRELQHQYLLCWSLLNVASQTSFTPMSGKLN